MRDRQPGGSVCGGWFGRCGFGTCKGAAGATAPAEAPTPVLRPSQATAVRHVLVVDDSRGQRRLLARMLSGWGHVVREAASGAEALRCAATARWT
jgi:PleD family two-component response regulator